MESKWYCKLPWTGFSNDPDGRVRPCCLYKDHIKDDAGNEMFVQTHSVQEIFTSKYMHDLRNEFRSGAQPKGCSTCIIDEQNGYTSKRQQYLDNPLDADYDADPEFPVEYQMILSNACNLKCRSCTPSHSSLWQAEHKIMWGHTGYKMPHGQSGENDSVLWNKRSEWIPSLQRLEIVGGEPFYINRWKILWKELIEQGYSKNIYMDMSTNCTIYGGDVLEELIPNFARIGVGLSIDGLGKTYEYLRHPGVWSEVEENITKYNDLRIKFAGHGFAISVSHTIGWINAWTLPEFHTYFKTKAPLFRIWNNIIHQPTHMSIYMIPAGLKTKITEKWEAYDWGEYTTDVKAILKFMNSQQPTDAEIKKAYEQFKKTDVLRNENLLDVVPKEILDDIRPYY